MRVSVQKSAIVATPTGIARLNSHRLAALHTETAGLHNGFVDPQHDPIQSPQKAHYCPGPEAPAQFSQWELWT